MNKSVLSEWSSKQKLIKLSCKVIQTDDKHNRRHVSVWKNYKNISVALNLQRTIVRVTTHTWEKENRTVENRSGVPDQNESKNTKRFHSGGQRRSRTAWKEVEDSLDLAKVHDWTSETKTEELKEKAINKRLVSYET